MSTPLSRSTVVKLNRNWEAIRDLQFRTPVCSELSIGVTNLDKYVGLPLDDGSTSLIHGLLPEATIRKTKASHNFDKLMRRYTSCIAAADRYELDPHDPSDRAVGVVKDLRQGALALGVGSFDAYVRNFTIEKYLHLVFSERPPDKVHRAWKQAIKAAVEDSPDIMTELAMMEPSTARVALAERVFAAQQVRIVTSEYDSVLGNLRSTALDLKVDVNDPTTDPGDQFLQLSPVLFDSYSNARHLIVHTGGSAATNAIPYCAAKVPVRFLATFLSALVSTIESKWSTPT